MTFCQAGTLEQSYPELLSLRFYDVELTACKDGEKGLAQPSAAPCPVHLPSEELRPTCCSEEHELEAKRGWEGEEGSKWGLGGD